MPRYNRPDVYYQSGIQASTAVEVAYIKSLSWANRMNNNGNFELILPKDSSLTPFVPRVNGYVRLSPGDTIMQIEKKETICDTKGNFWYKLGGRTKQADDEITRDAKNNNYFFRYVYDSIASERYVTFRKGSARVRINSVDLLESNTYEDNLGGFTEVVEDTVTDAFTWGTIITGQPRVIVNRVSRGTMVTATIPGNAQISQNEYDPRSGEQYHDPVSLWSYEPFTTSNTPQITVGSASGTNGRMDRVTYNGSWIKNDVTNDNIVFGPVYHFTIYVNTYLGIRPQSNYVQGKGIIPVRTITLKTEQEYLDEMRALITPQMSGSQPAIINRQVTHVEGGHAGYAFKLKAKGEVEKRYKVDFNLGDTISVNDTRLGVYYTGVVSGAVETIDGNGYNVDIEIGTLGATLEQRVQRVI